MAAAMREVMLPVRISLSLTDEQAGYARALVAQGQYPSVGAVLRRALEVLRREEERLSAQVRVLQSLIDQRQSGQPVPSEENGLLSR
jgi:antitoxin ParD1/3/4